MATWFSAPGEVALADINEVALAVCRSRGHAVPTQHAGILYRDEDGELRMLDLASHRTLRNNPVGDWLADYAVVHDHGIDSEQALWIAAYCSTVWTANKEGRIPYAFTYEGGGFSGDSGKYVAGETAPHGLTCSTFILGLHQGVGFTLLNLGTWPKQRWADKLEQEAILGMLNDGENVPQEHLNVISSEIGLGAARFRPQEVVSAYARAGRPPSGVEFTVAEPRGWDVLTCLMKEELAAAFVSLAIALRELCAA